MKIGELARITYTQTETIRFYERKQLLPAPARTGGNYRMYGEEHVERVSFIRHCRSLGLALEEIRILLRVKDAPGEKCDQLNALLDEHIGQVKQRIRELRQLEKQLSALRRQCHDGRDSADCGILLGLTGVARLTPGPSSIGPGHADRRPNAISNKPVAVGIRRDNAASLSNKMRPDERTLPPPATMTVPGRKRTTM